MISVENVDVWGFEHAIRGMRNPMNSWAKSDSHPGGQAGYQVGKNDLDLMGRLHLAGQPHRKYLRQIFVSLDITAPLYWWKEFDTYKVGTTANSCSTMHKIQAKEFTLDDFSIEHLKGESLVIMKNLIHVLNSSRESFNFLKNKDYWWQMIQLLPTSYNQKRTVTMTYENVMNILDYRQGHKLDEWNDFCSELLSLPYIKELREYEVRK